jgi:hypothetical protein
MKSHIFSIMILSVLLISCNHAFSDQAIEQGKHVNSPDGRFTAELTDGSDSCIQITSNTTGQLYKIRVLQPVYLLKWTDSQTLLAIEHLAGGSQAVLNHFDGTKWNRFEVDPTNPPPPYHHYSVIRQQIGPNNVRLTYKLTDEKGNGVVSKFYLCSFDVDPETGSISNMHQHEISSSDYARLRPEARSEK